MHWSAASFAVPAGDRLECTLCPTRCRLADGQTGACHVRRNLGGRMETATFASSVRHLDPIERKPFFHFRPGSRALTLAAPGCTFRCTYCVNHRMSQFGRGDEAPWTADPVDPDEVVAAAAAASASVALSYTEPALAAELTLALAERGRDAGVAVVWKSNGFLTPEAAGRLAPALAAVNIDIKADDDDAHHRLTGAPVGPVVEALRILHAAGVWIEVSTPLIPTVSAEPAVLGRIADTVAGIDPAIPWHLLRFTPTYRMADHRPTPPAALADAVRLGRRAGLHYVYVERALGTAGRATSCPGCGMHVVERGLWCMERNLLVDGDCPACGAPVEGRW